MFLLGGNALFTVFPWFMRKNTVSTLKNQLFALVLIRYCIFERGVI